MKNPRLGAEKFDADRPHADPSPTFPSIAILAPRITVLRSASLPLLTRRRRASSRQATLACVVAFVSAASLGCAGIGDQPPASEALVANQYPQAAASPMVVYRASWHIASFQTPIAPGATSDPQPVIAATDTYAYAVLAPGYDVASAAPPTRMIVVRSRAPFAVAENATLRIGVDDTSFDGNCVSGRPLSQTDADFVTHIVFPDLFAHAHYDAATCTTTFDGASGAP